MEQSVKNLRIAYCEDEEAQDYYLKKVLNAYGRLKNTDYALECFRSGEELWMAHDCEAPDFAFPYDLIILDIRLRAEDAGGMELARRIRSCDRTVPIVFLSNLKEYVFQGYEVSAARYLLKPVTQEGLFPVLDGILQEKLSEPAYLLASVSGEYRKIELDMIRYLEACGHYLKLHQANGRILEWKQNFSAVADRLPADDFVRIHRSYCVHLKYVRRITRTVCVLDEEELPVSRGAWKSLNEAFIAYYRRRGQGPC